MKVFLSYKREEAVIAERLQCALIERGHEVWRDAGNIQPGEIWLEEINKALVGSERVVAMFSDRAFSSDIIYNEFMHGLRQKSVIGIKTDQPMNLIHPFNQAPILSIYNWLKWDLQADLDYLSDCLSLTDDKFRELYRATNATSN